MTIEKRIRKIEESALRRKNTERDFMIRDYDPNDPVAIRRRHEEVFGPMKPLPDINWEEFGEYLRTSDSEIAQAFKQEFGLF
jgi:hypothetical protein